MKKILLLLAIAVLIASVQAVYTGPKTTWSEINLSQNVTDDINMGGYNITDVGGLDVDGSTLFGPSTGRKTFYSLGYSVPTATQTTINLQEGVTSLVNGWNYRIQLVTIGTSSATGAVYIIRQTAAGTWTAILVSYNGITSNAPLLLINGTYVKIYHNHASTYTINTFVEGYYVNNTAAVGAPFFGLEGAMTNYAGKIGIGVSAPTVGLELPNIGTSGYGLAKRWTTYAGPYLGESGLVNCPLGGALGYTTVGPFAWCDYVTDGTADDVQINAAIDAVYAAGGGTVTLAPAILNGTGLITIHPGVILAGSGIGYGTRYNSNATIQILFDPAGTTDSGAGLQNINICRTGVSDGASLTAGTYGIKIQSANTFLNNVKVVGSQYGIEIGNASVDKILNIDFDRVYVEICDYGLYVVNAADVHVRGGRIGQNGLDGARICGVTLVTTAEAIHFDRTLICNNGGWTDCVRIYGGYWFTFDTVDLETATNAAIHIGVGNPTFVRVKDCWISQDVKFDSSAYGVRFIFDGNTFFVGKGFVYGGGVPANMTTRDNDFLT